MMIQLFTLLIVSLSFQMAFAKGDPNVDQYNQGAAGYAAPYNNAVQCETCAKDQSDAGITDTPDYSQFLSDADSDAPKSGKPVKGAKGTK
jgi:hypothetical protein